MGSSMGLPQHTALPCCCQHCPGQSLAPGNRNGALNGVDMSISSTDPALRHLGTSALLLSLAPAPIGGSSDSIICGSHLGIGEELERDRDAQKP